VQQVAVEAGQQVNIGATLAKVAQQGELKCELRVQESQVSEVATGQAVRVDTRNGIANGRVSRIEPSVEAGAVVVEVLFEEELPKAARPDLSVEGTIELQRITDTLYVERPVTVNANATLPVFRVLPDSTALKGPVQFGAASSTQVQVLQGLAAGDQIILGDAKQWDLVEKLRLR
jgi:HlyD family secretion protein